ncbi:aspartyl-tRNA(Asn)/glutamyl-tRNA(Gln) amidotransferase subunit A [Roseovarius lutimaris]|uniref:Aspartyl-tRNA(Asn)/glutamyl-tRNA(Gln) amidotransferase subunit A n=1 Tax=Roseovarius lutimaris TaxID=1005928 RepID=A0A1I5BRQ7_9RHOB|nr:amidase [Roseovarius lutimaris]SFN77328.1 aspartyl-tRNA(Asn)/glutamyl-tRNA(Gln) amidotransferase subunit A [Roseovarius lutimaris]
MNDNGNNEWSRREMLAGVSGVALAVGAGGFGLSGTANAQPTPGLPQSVTAAGEAFRSGSLSCRELTQTYLNCIAEFEPKLNAFISILNDEALATAEERDAELAAGQDRGPLHGIPIVVKDLFEVAGTFTTVGSEAFADRMSDSDATIIRKLKDAGCVIIGKTNMNAFAAGVSGTNSTFGDVHNPWDLERSPGGSSSGTGAAIAAGLCLGGPGTDTGGSIRVPASWLGIAGIRPTSGLVSLNGVYPRSHSLDTAGPLARNIRDLAIFLDVMAGFDPNDPNSSLAQPRLSYTKNLDKGVKGLRIGLVENYSLTDIDAPVEESVRAAADTFASLGAEIVNIKVPLLQGQLNYAALFSEILLYEFNQILGDQFRSTPDAERLFGPIVTSNIADGSAVTREQYEARIAERPGVLAEIKEVFESVDAILTPSLPTTAPLLNAAAQDFGRGRQFTIPFSYTGLPSVAVPCGFSPEGMPIGLQLVGDHFQEGLLLQMAAAFEAATDFGMQRPPIFCKG